MLPRDLENESGESRSTYPVVVGVDGSFTAIRAARWAAAVAERFEAPLLIVHAKPRLEETYSEVIPDPHAAETIAQRESAEAILVSAERAVRGHFRNLRISAAQADGPADVVLVELSRDARLIVLGSDAVTLGTAILVGSTTTAVATHSICPVVAWRGDAPTPTTQPIVLGIDDDHDSRIAVAAAFEFAYRLGVGITAIHSVSMQRPARDIALPVMIDWKQVERAAQQHLSDTVDPWVELYPTVEVTEVVETDAVSRALLRCAEGAQLIVVGSRGRGRLAGALLGSTGLNLLHHSSIPIMICRSVDRGR